MIDDRHSIGGGGRRARVGDVTDHHLSALIDKRLRLARRTDEHAHRCTASQEATHEAGTKEPRRAGDEDRQAACSAAAAGFVSDATRARTRERPTFAATFVTVGAWVSMFVYAALASGQ